MNHILKVLRFGLPYLRRYWVRPVNDQLVLSAGEHHDIRWCSAGELDGLQPPMSAAVKWYCRKVIEEISEWRPADSDHQLRA